GALVDQAPAASGVPLLAFTGGTVSTTGPVGNLVNVDGAPGSATLTLKRPLVSATGTALNLFNGLLRIGLGGDVSTISSSAFVELIGGTYTGGTDGAGTSGALLQMSGGQLTLAGGGVFLQAQGGATVTTLQGSLLELTNGSNFTGGQLMLVGGAGTSLTSA